jgi:LmbE family N-acetylglucosaminyl deacetylase
MIKLVFDKQKNLPLNVLCLGAHSDDIEIGCGATILRLAEEFPMLNLTWVVFSAKGERALEAENSANEFTKPIPNKKILSYEFRDGYFPSNVEIIKDVFEELKNSTSPDVIFTHYRQDLHQDHRQICELTWNTWRNHFILEYEVPKYDGDLGSPNFFMNLERQTCDRKIELLMRYFQTQGNKHWFTPDTFNALLRLRGIESKSPTGFAEAFYCRKAVF